MPPRLEPPDNRKAAIAYGFGLILLAVMLKVLVFGPVEKMRRQVAEVPAFLSEQKALKGKVIKLATMGLPASHKIVRKSDLDGRIGYYELLSADHETESIRFTSIAVGEEGRPTEKLQGWIPFHVSLESDFETSVRYFSLLESRRSRVRIVELNIQATSPQANRLKCTLRGHLSSEEAPQ